MTGRTPLLGAGIRVRPLRLDANAQIVAPEPELIELTEDRRAKLVAFVEGSTRMPEEARKRVLAQLAEPSVPAQLVSRIETRMGG